MQINLRHSKEASAELLQRLGELRNANYVVLAQEPHQYNSRIKSLSGAGNIYYARNSKTDKPRSCIITSRSLKAWLVPELSDDDNTVCLIKINGKQVYLVSSYLDGHKTLTDESTFNKIIVKANNKNIPILVGCDANAHSQHWGCDDTNARGIVMEEIISQVWKILHVQMFD